jgi:hypothetical protein
VLEINKQADAYGPFQRIWPEMWADMFRIEWEIFSALTSGDFTDEKSPTASGCGFNRISNHQDDLAYK